MDTNKDSAASEVPTFKVARVGNDRKRKGGAFSFLRGGGARGGWKGALGGSGAGGAAGGAGGGAAAFMGVGLNLSKMMLFLLISVGGLGAVGLGRLIGGASMGGEVKKSKPFAMASKDVKMEGDMSNLPSNGNTIPNSLGYLTGSKDGLTPEERAKKEADAAAAAEAQRIADEEAAKKAEADRLAGEPAVDPNALLASAQADGGAGGKGSAFGKKFGSLTSSMGGGSSLSGGAGLSGGVNRQFGQSGAITKGAAGRLSAAKGASRPSYGKAGGSRLAASKTKGFARKQLANANAYSRKGAAAGKGETAASDAGTAFDNNPGAGNVISGPGIGAGTGPSGGSDTSPNPGGGGGGGGPTTPQAPTDCGADKYLTIDGTCETIATTGGTSANLALDMMAKMAMGLLAAIAVISAIKAALDGSFVAAGYGAALGAIIGMMGAIIALLGIAIIAMGDYAQGTVFTLTGGFIAAVAFVPGMSSILTSGTMVIASAAGLVLGAAAKMLDGDHKDKAPVAAQQ